MSTIEKKDLDRLAALIVENIKADFATKRLSGNLVNTIKVYNSEYGIKIEIPAPVYNMYRFFKDGVVIPSARGGSYASELNDKGSSFMYYSESGKRELKTPRNHIGYVDRAINNALSTWLEGLKGKYDILNTNY